MSNEKYHESHKKIMGSVHATPFTNALEVEKKASKAQTNERTDKRTDGLTNRLTNGLASRPTFWPVDSRLLH